MIFRFLGVLGAVFIGGYLVVATLVYTKQRSLLFFPTHDTAESPLTAWIVNGEVIGYCRETASPKIVWLMLHGNGGQASHRSYVLSRISVNDAFYVLEYPGYGLRRGSPSKDSIDGAAEQALRALQKRFSPTSIQVVGESLGTGPACYLASLTDPPARLVLLVPYDRLSDVASEKWSWLPVHLLMKDDWDNIDALKNYRGPVEIFGAIDDRVIPMEHAKNLADHVPQSRFQTILGGHDWASSDSVFRFD
ncbi:MAG TPA: alpha/beta hydrolase [Opitutaceae bacterium]